MEEHAVLKLLIIKATFKKDTSKTEYEQLYEAETMNNVLKSDPFEYQAIFQNDGVIFITIKKIIGDDEGKFLIHGRLFKFEGEEIELLFGIFAQEPLHILEHAYLLWSKEEDKKQLEKGQLVLLYRDETN